MFGLLSSIGSFGFPSKVFDAAKLIQFCSNQQSESLDVASLKLFGLDEDSGHSQNVGNGNLGIGISALHIYGFKKD